jgi:hypothetical protein
MEIFDIFEISCGKFFFLIIKTTSELVVFATPRRGITSPPPQRWY